MGKLHEDLSNILERLNRKSLNCTWPKIKLYKTQTDKFSKHSLAGKQFALSVFLIQKNRTDSVQLCKTNANILLFFNSKYLDVCEMLALDT